MTLPGIAQSAAQAAQDAAPVPPATAPAASPANVSPASRIAALSASIGEGGVPGGFATRTRFRARLAKISVEAPLDVAVRYGAYCDANIKNFNDGATEAILKLCHAAEKNLSLLDIPGKLEADLFARDEGRTHTFMVLFPAEAEAFVTKHRFDRTPAGERITKTRIIFVAILNLIGV